MDRGRASSLLLFVLVLLPRVEQAVGCDDAGILVDIHNRKVNGRPDIIRYGLSLGLGSPSQNNSLWPAITHNETAFSAPDYCGAEAPTWCLDGTSGFFSADNSSSWRNASSPSSLDDTRVYGNTGRVDGEDTLGIWQTEVYGGPQTLMPLDHFPVAVLSNYTALTNYALLSGNQNAYGPGDTLGLGSTSTILSKLVEQGKIAARSFGLYLGPGFDRVGDDRSGSLVLGGYDAGRFNGSVGTYDLVPALPQNSLSPFKITVDDVSLETSGGETVLQMADASFDAYLTTDRKAIEFPSAVTKKLAAALRATTADNNEATLKLPAIFEGNLTITLSNGLTLKFDSDWMMDGSLNTPISAGFQSNSSFGSFNPEDTGPIIFGAAFLARAYLFVNYDAQPPHFSLAQALPDVTDIEKRPYCADDIPIPVSAVHTHSRTSSRKALIGGLCGGLLGGLCVLALTWFLCGSRIRKFLRRNDPRLRSDQDSYFDRPSIKQTFHYWKSNTWKTMTRGGNKIGVKSPYRDVETGRKTQPHVSTIMYSSLGSEKEDPVTSLAKPAYALEGRSSLSRQVQYDSEKGLLSVTHGERSTSPPAAGSVESVRKPISTAPKSLLHGWKAPPLVSMFNAQCQSQHNHSRDVSETLVSDSPADEAATTSTKVPVIDIIQEVDRQAYDKSLPATPAPSTPRSLMSRLSQSSWPQSELAVDASATTPRIPSFAFTPTNITFKAPSSPVPPIPAIPDGYVSGMVKGQSLSPTNPQHDDTDLLMPEPTPPPALTTYSFWRSKRSRSVATSRSNTSHNPQSADAETREIPEMTRSTTVSTTRSRSRSRSRVAMAARISRFTDRHQPGVREIIIRRRARSRSKSSRLRPTVDLSAFADAPGAFSKSKTANLSQYPTATDGPASNTTTGFVIKRKALNSTAFSRARARALSGVSPCVSAMDDDLLGDRAISPVSSMGRGRDLDIADDEVEASRPPVPPFPPGMYVHRSMDEHL